MAKKSSKPRHQETPAAGPPCRRCGSRLTRIDRAFVGEAQRRAKWFFKRWFRCDVPTCPTKLVMIVEEGAIGWNVKPWPLEQIREWQRRNKAAKHPPARSRDIALETLDEMSSAPATPGRLIPARFTDRREGPPPEPSDSSPPW